MDATLYTLVDEDSGEVGTVILASSLAEAIDRAQSWVAANRPRIDWALEVGGVWEGDVYTAGDHVATILGPEREWSI